VGGRNTRCASGPFFVLNYVINNINCHCSVNFTCVKKRASDYSSRRIYTGDTPAMPLVLSRRILSEVSGIDSHLE
jgi:hypothetical protein